MVRYETMTKKLYQHYIEAKIQDDIEKPLTWALYHTLQDISKLEGTSVMRNDLTLGTVRSIGKWYDVGSLSCRCSCCGCKSNKETKYCPNCGARMEGV